MGLFRRFFSTPSEAVLWKIPNLRSSLPIGDKKSEAFNVPLQIPEAANLILGQSHLAKTCEDSTRSSSIRSWRQICGRIQRGFRPCLIRVEGNDDNCGAPPSQTPNPSALATC